MLRLRPPFYLALIAGLALGPAAAAQAPSQPGPDPIEAQLQAIADSLQQIVNLLALQVDNQKAELAVQRLDMARREIVVLERELHQARTSRDSRAQDQTRLIAQRDAMEAGLDAEDIEESERDSFRRQFEIEFQALESGLWQLDQRILDLERELNRTREDLESWEELVAETLR